MFLFLSVTLIVGSIATLLTLKISKVFAKLITRINYRILVLSIVLFVTLLVFIFSSWYGLLVLIISSALGLVAPIKNIPRNSLMGCLLLPVILFFLP